MVAVASGHTVPMSAIFAGLHFPCPRCDRISLDRSSIDCLLGNANAARLLESYNSSRRGVDRRGGCSWNVVLNERRQVAQVMEQTQSRHGQNLTSVCEWMTDCRYEGIHAFRITVNRSRWGCYDLLLVLVAILCYSVWDSFAGTFPFLVFATSLVFWIKRNRVEQEAVVVMPNLGIQLETVYCSKKVDRRFVSLDRILAPVINEAVTPVTCYFYLALILQDEKDMLLAFENLRPPLKMLSCIWRSIHEALGTETCKILPPRSDSAEECEKKDSGWWVGAIPSPSNLLKLKSFVLYHNRNLVECYWAGGFISLVSTDTLSWMMLPFISFFISS